MFQRTLRKHQLKCRKYQTRHWTRSKVGAIHLPILQLIFRLSSTHFQDVFSPKRGLGFRSRYSDSLRTGMVQRSNPGGGRDFPHPSRPALGPTQPPTQWLPGVTAEVKRPGSGVDHPPPSRAEVKERVELYICSPSGPSWPSLGRILPLPLPLSSPKFFS